MERQQDEKRPYAVLNVDCLDAMKRIEDAFQKTQEMV